MPGNVIRDVVIRIALEQVQSEIKTPDLKPVIDQQRQVAESVGLSTVELDRQSTAGDKAVESLSKDTAGEAAKKFTDATKEATGAVESEMQALMKSHDSFMELDNLEFSAILTKQKYTKEVEKATEAIAKHKEELGEAAEQMEGAGEGVLKLARSFVLLSGGNQDLESLIKSLSQIQGTLDLLQGVPAVLKGVRDGWTTFTTAVTGAAAAEAALAATTNGLTVAEAGATAGAIAETGAVTGLAVALAGAEAAAIGAAAAMAAAFAPVTIVLTIIAGSLYLLHNYLDIFGIKAANAAKQAAENMEIYNERLKTARDLAESIAHKRESRGDEETRVKEKLFNADPEEQLVNLEKARAKTAEEIAARKREGFGYSEQETHLAERLKDQDEKRFDIIKRIGDGLREALAAQKEAIAAAERGLELEKERTQSLKERLGHLNEAEKAEILAVKQRIAAGDATESDYSFAEGKSFALDKKTKAAVSKHFADRGEDFAQDAGLDLEEGERAAKEKLEQAKGADTGDTIESKEAQIKENDARLIEAAHKLEESVKAAHETMLRLFEHMAAEFLEQQREANRKLLERRNARGAT
jgi:hypothetical protein